MSKRTCTFEGCNAPHKARGWCANHYLQWRTTGTVKARVWGELGGNCVVCGVKVQSGGGRRKHCSGTCQAIDSYHKQARATESVCNFCGATYALTRERTGRMQRSDTKWCPDCGRDSPDVQRFRRYRVTRERYEAAMAAGCQICGAMKPLHIDHDHNCCPTTKGKKSMTCGECVRGFICGPCNRGIGLFFDNIQALESAAAYLKRGGAST